MIEESVPRIYGFRPREKSRGQAKVPGHYRYLPEVQVGRGGCCVCCCFGWGSRGAQSWVSGHYVEDEPATSFDPASRYRHGAFKFLSVFVWFYITFDFWIATYSIYLVVAICSLIFIVWSRWSTICLPFCLHFVGDCQLAHFIANLAWTNFGQSISVDVISAWWTSYCWSTTGEWMTMTWSEEMLRALVLTARQFNILNKANLFYVFNP